MPEEYTTPDLVELARRAVEAVSRRDFDDALTMFTPNAVWDWSLVGLGVYEGREAIRGFLEEWSGVYGELKMEVREGRDLGHGVGFAVVSQRGRLPRTTAWVQEAFPLVSIWADGLIQHTASYTDIDKARAAAERLAQERG